jgi:hypothetical protein
MQPRIISSHSQFQPLQEVWLGGTYPADFYRHLGSETFDLFAKITEITNRDFDKLAAVLISLGVHTVRPRFESVDDFLDAHDNLLKPPISPCDFALTLNDTLYLIPQYYSNIDPYQHAIDDYIKNNQKVHMVDRSSADPWAWITFPGLVKTGKDIVIDYDPNIKQSKHAAVVVAENLSNNYRVHLSSTGEHNDGVFCPIKPGHIMTSHYRSTYDQSFPNWQVHHLPDITNKNIKHLGLHHKWWLPGVDYGHFNSQVIAVAETWLGNPQETIFEVNMLAVDEHNIICGAYNKGAWDYFGSIGVTPHLVEFESRMFWDAGIHCVTSDIHRTGHCCNYWPDRGPNGIYKITEWQQ